MIWLPGIHESMRAARDRLRALGLPEDRGRDMRADAVTEKLYAVIAFGELALAAQAAGDWELFAAQYKRMLVVELGSRRPQIAQTLHVERQRSLRRKPRSKAKQTARRLYDEHHPASAKEFWQRLEAAGVTAPLPTVNNWLTEFRRAKKNSR